MQAKEALIIFVRNPVLGKVKTRIAATAGEETALAVYKMLLKHTKSVAEMVSPEKCIFYADEINNDDLWNGHNKFLQTGEDLGERMKNAFYTLFSKGFERIIIIGSDCFELTATELAQGFLALDDHEMVIGPAIDGGYYLLGMQCPMKNIFSNKTWSSNTVLADTLKDAQQQHYVVKLLKTLQDIDEEKDIPEALTNYLPLQLQKK